MIFVLGLLSGFSFGVLLIYTLGRATGKKQYDDSVEQHHVTMNILKDANIYRDRIADALEKIAHKD